VDRPLWRQKRRPEQIALSETTHARAIQDRLPLVGPSGPSYISTFS
jgi:hypothetical protein